jgi:hypothetical protein
MRLAPATITRHVKELGRVHCFLQTPTVLSKIQLRPLSQFVIQPSILTHGARRHAVGSVAFGLRFISHEQAAKDLNQRGVDEALSDFDTAVGQEKEKQIRAPWHRQGADLPPVRRQRSAGAMTKGGCPYMRQPCERQLTKLQGNC